MKQNTQTSNLKQCIPHYDTHQSYDPQYISAALQSIILSPGHHKVSHFTSNIYFRVQIVKPVDFAHDTRHSRPSPFPVCRPVRLMCRFPTVPDRYQHPRLGSTTRSLPELVFRESPFSSLSSERFLFRVPLPYGR